MEEQRGRQRHRTTARARVRPGAAERDEDLLQLRGLVHDHLDPVGLPDAVRLRDVHGRAGGDDDRLARRRVLRDPRRARDGRGRVELSDRRWPLLLGGEARARVGRQPGGLELVRRLVQLCRPGGRHRRHRLRAVVLHQRVPEHHLRRLDGAARHHRDLRGRPLHPRTPEHLRDPAGRQVERHLGLVARRRRDRDRPGHRRPQPAQPDRHRHRVLDVLQRHGKRRRRTRNGRARCCWASRST